MLGASPQQSVYRAALVDSLLHQLQRAVKLSAEQQATRVWFARARATVLNASTPSCTSRTLSILRSRAPAKQPTPTPTPTPGLGLHKRKPASTLQQDSFEEMSDLGKELLLQESAQLQKKESGVLEQIKAAEAKV